jgi:glutamate-1-semialdehyde 2,1-aminomutase
VAGKSEDLYRIACECLPGGVNSPVRAFKAVGGTPPFIARGQGSRIWDVDGKEYIDYVASWGPLILGHAHPEVVDFVCRVAVDGTSFGAPTELEVELAKRIVEAVPSMEMVRFVNSGTEATMSALRLARGYTGRNKVLKFEGCYHGHVDYLLAKAGSGVLTFSIPGTPGVPEDFTRHTLLAVFNDLDSVKRAFEQVGEEMAAVIVEPVMGNAGVIPPVPGFLEGLRKITREYGVLLIFDEVITGFRVSYGGAQELYGVTPDLTCLGKVIGGGLPVGVYGGKREIMEHVAPLGPVYQAGTLSGNPLAMAAGLKTLDILSRPAIYELLEERANRLEQGMKDIVDRMGICAVVNRVGSMMCFFFTQGEMVEDYAQALTSDTELYSRYFWGMLKGGINLAPSQFEASFVSSAHSQEDISRTLEIAEGVLASLV